MTQRHFPGETVGVIGSSISSALIAQEFGRLGYRVGSLVLTDFNPVRQFVSWQTIADNYDEVVLRHFASRVDLVIAETGLLSSQDFLILKEETDVLLSDDLISITTDRLLEKAYLDSLQMLVAPFAMITTLTDLKEAIEYIGFPCVLKPTQRHLPHSDQSVILYSENDFTQAEAMIEMSTCILEAWIPSEKSASLTVIRNERGEMLVYPLFEIIEAGTSGDPQVRYPLPLHHAIEKEITRVARLLAISLDIVGALTIEFLITSAGVVYLNAVDIGFSDVALFTMGAMSVSHFEAMARATLGLALPELQPRSLAAISLQMPYLNRDNVLNQFMLRTDWGFALFNPVGNAPEDVMGQVIVTGDSIANCERQIELTELLAD